MFPLQYDLHLLQKFNVFFRHLVNTVIAMVSKTLLTVTIVLVFLGLTQAAKLSGSDEDEQDLASLTLDQMEANDYFRRQRRDDSDSSDSSNDSSEPSDSTDVPN